MGYRVKLFDHEHEEDLEEEINRFLAKIDESNIKDIKFQVATTNNENDEQIYCFSAMIIYKA
jgi:hypothetical protein